jgi:hypothetical protein
LNPFAFNIESPDLFYSAYAADPFDPLELSPIIWLDANDASTLSTTSNGGSLSYWNNKSSAGASNNPTFTHGNLQYSTN